MLLITGIGSITSIGNNVPEMLEAVRSRKPGLGKIRHIKTRHADQLCIGEVPDDDAALKVFAGIRSETKITRTSLLGIIAAREALQDAGIQHPGEFRTGLVSATSVGGMGIAENHFMEYLDPNDKGEYLDYIHQLDCSDSTEVIAKELGIKDFLSTISTACSSSANSIMFGARLIKNNILDRVIVGGTDSLSRFTINGFNCLKILDPHPCRPFDHSRAGLNLGEGAGYIVLESEKAAKGKRVYAALTGYSNANDAYHQTASSPEGEGAFMAIQKAFGISGISPSNISYINAHGTGTELNDLSEGIAIKRIFGSSVPPFSSTKAFTGHTLAAAGGVEAVLSVLAIAKGIIYPNLNFSNPIPELGMIPVTEIKENQTVKHVLSNSFGFGGNTSSLIFSKI